MIQLSNSSIESSRGRFDDRHLARLTAILAHRYGVDFRQYSPASLRRRARMAMLNEGLLTPDALTVSVLWNEACARRVISSLGVHATGMFRDPAMFLQFRRTVVPLLRRKSTIRIWHAGCSSGEEAYSLAILLSEEGLLGRSRIYATDRSHALIERARSGRYPTAAISAWERSYREAGGIREPGLYFTKLVEGASFAQTLRDAILFSRHDLTRDGVFSHFDVVLCRNVLIYFNDALRSHVQRLILNSLSAGGILVLGIKETLRFTPYATEYEELVPAVRLYRRLERARHRS